MRKPFFLMVAMLLSVALTGGYCGAAGNIYGATGLIETPTDLVTEKGDINLSGTYLSEILDSDDAVTIWGGAYGVGNNMEASWASIDSDAPGVSSKNILGVKFSVTQESSASTGIAVGVLDTGKKFKYFNPDIDKSSYYIVFGKTLNLNQNPYKRSANEHPVRATFGYGKGIYDGVFAGLNFGLSPKVEAQLEYLKKGIRNKNTVNAAVQMNLIPNLSIQVGALGMEDFYGNISFGIGKKF